MLDSILQNSGLIPSLIDKAAQVDPNTSKVYGFLIIVLIGYPVLIAIAMGWVWKKYINYQDAQQAKQDLQRKEDQESKAKFAEAINARISEIGHKFDIEYKALNTVIGSFNERLLRVEIKTGTDT